MCLSLTSHDGLFSLSKAGDAFYRLSLSLFSYYNRISFRIKPANRRCFVFVTFFHGGVTTLSDWNPISSATSIRYLEHCMLQIYIYHFLWSSLHFLKINIKQTFFFFYFDSRIQEMPSTLIYTTNPCFRGPRSDDNEANQKLQNWSLIFECSFVYCQRHPF